MQITKKIITSSVLAFAMIGHIAHAQATTSPATSSIAATEEAQTIPLSAEKQARIVNLVANMSNRADVLILRFENIIYRAESRIKKMQDAGTNMNEALLQLNEARKGLQMALDEMKGIDQRVQVFVSNENPVASWAAIKESFGVIKNNLNYTKHALRLMVSEIKKAAEGNTAPAEQDPTTPNQ